MNSLSAYYLPPTKMFNIDITKFKTKKELGYPNHKYLWMFINIAIKLQEISKICY